MRRVLAAAVLMAFMPTANAQDKGKADFSSNAEFRARYWMMQNPGGNEDTLSSNTDADARFKLGVNYKANEKVSATATLIHWSEFGKAMNGGAGGSPVGTNTTDTTVDTGAVQDLMVVNQAFMTWASSDDLKFHVGRMNYQVADGALIGINDWENVPYMFEGLLAKWEAEFGKFDFVAFKLRDVQGTTASGNAQHNMYGINFDLKTMPEWMKALNAHIFKNNGDAREQAAANESAFVMTSDDGLDTMRYGLMAHFGFADFELKAWYEASGGKIKNIAVGGAKTEFDYKGNMMAVELAYNLANFMNSRFHFLYHKDSGDDTADTELQRYDGFFTEKHNSAGAMDLFGWGNLTFMQLGWNFKTDDKTSFGLQYSMFSLTEENDAQGFTAGRNGGALAAAGQSTDSKLGDEIDLWATHSYDSNLSTTLRLGYFMPGDRFEPAAPAAKSTDAIMHVMVEGKASF